MGGRNAYEVSELEDAGMLDSIQVEANEGVQVGSMRQRNFRKGVPAPDAIGPARHGGLNLFGERGARIVVRGRGHGLDSHLSCLSFRPE